MKIAVTYENDKIFAHFGHTEKFKIYEVEDNVIKDTKILETNGQGHGALAKLLKENNINVLICGGIGNGAINALNEVDIKVYAGIEGIADEAIEKLLNGTLKQNSNANCNHHHEEEHHCSGSCQKNGCEGNH